MNKMNFPTISNKLFTSALFLFLVVFSTNAQDKKAKDLLDQVTAKIKSYQNISLDFKYSLNNSCSALSL